ncbi:hypothetical protein [Aeoliella sp.]|uniref:hypothetical protein n=1 Tax=Aeoliella sp. TaxID=2795800 RepID=UPI003CCBE41B
MFDLLAEIVVRPALGAFQGMVGLLWPAKDEEVRRLQRWCLAVLLGFLLSATLAVVMLRHGWWLAALVLAVGAFALGHVCGKLGATIEKLSSD